MKSPQIKVPSIPGARKAVMPHHVEPMKAVLVDEPFDRSGWIFEEKYDGIRALSYIRNGKLDILSRNQKPMTMRYPELADLSKWINAKEAILDGEIIVLNKRGTASFSDLQARFGVTDKSVIEKLVKSQKIVYFVFDLLYLDGYDLMAARLLDRKAILAKIFRENTVFQIAPHTTGNGIKRFKDAERRHLEGVMAKNGDSHYEQRRSTEWLKIKTTMRQEAVIVGYTTPHGSRKYFGALCLGLYDGKRLVSVGKVGTGFDRKRLKEIYDLMHPLKTNSSPFSEMPSSLRESAQWLKPKLVCEVKFTERTKEGSFRHPAFVGLRFDKKPSDCTFEAKKETRKTIKQAEHKL
jgi:bifunctional non-homologous end joining protein LigD